MKKKLHCPYCGMWKPTFTKKFNRESHILRCQAKSSQSSKTQNEVYDRRADTITLINEKKASLMSEDRGQDLETIQALAPVKQQVESVIGETQKFPEEVKRDETIEAWSKHLQTYFDVYRDLMAWINEMMAKITAPDLAKDAEALARVKNPRVEIESRNKAFDHFYREDKIIV